MSTHEERIAALEQTTRNHRSVLQTFNYELTAVKELIQDVKDDMNGSFKQQVAYQIKTEQEIDARFNKVDARFDQVDARFSQVDARFDQVDARLDQVDVRFNKVEARLDKIEATMATKEDLAAMATKEDLVAMENRILNAFQQLMTMINTR